MKIFYKLKSIPLRFHLMIVLPFVFCGGTICAQGVLPAHRYANISSFIWDNTTSNGQIDNGTGTWNAANTTWLKSPLGANQAWVAGLNAVFGGNPGAGAAAAVTVSGTIDVRGIIFNNTPSGNFTLSSGTLNMLGGIITANQSATINSTLTGSGNYLHQGAGVLTIGGSNTYSGIYTVRYGTLQMAAANALGTANFILGDILTGTNYVSLFVKGSITTTGNITVTNNGSGIVTIGSYTSGTGTVFSGTIAADRSIVLHDSTGDRTSFSGVISGNPGTITLSGSGSWNSAAGKGARITLDNNANTFTAQIIIPTSKALQMNGTNAVHNQPIQNNGTLVLAAAGTSTIGTLTGASTGICEIHIAVGSTKTLSIGNDNGNGTYDGIIRNNAGTMSIVKTGTGTQLLTGTNIYTGTTAVNAGILGGTGSILSSSSTTINSGGTIMGGTGSGNAGTFTTGNLVFASASTAAVNVNSNGTSLSLIQVNGTCALGTTSKINLMSAMPAGTFTIISSTGTMSGTLPTLGINNSGRSISISQSGNTLRVTLS